MKSILSIILTIALLSSCSSSHDSRKNGSNIFGGGTWVGERADGEFYIEAKTNLALWEDFIEAELMWKKLAEEVCSGLGYTEVEVNLYSEEKVGYMSSTPSYITVKVGVAICNNSPLTS